MATRRGFTLIELLVVLAILGAVTTLAIRSASKLQERTSFESTQRALEVTAAALVGDGDPDEPGFVGDLGRMPIAPTGFGDVVEFVPLELWHRLPSVAPSGTSTLEDGLDDEIVALTGWRGPYLHLPPHMKAPNHDDDDDDDGWGHVDGYGKMIFLRREQTPAGNLVEWSVVSHGAHLDDPNDDFVLPLYLVEDGVEKINRLFTDLTGTVKLSATPPQPNASVTVVAYGPDPIDGGLRAVEADASPVPGTTTYLFDFHDEDDNRLTRGPWVVRAYVHTGPDPRLGTLAKSDVRRLSLAPRTHLIDLEVDVPGADDGGQGPPDPPKDRESSVPPGGPLSGGPISR